jgi:cytochrome c5
MRKQFNIIVVFMAVMISMLACSTGQSIKPTQHPSAVPTKASQPTQTQVKSTQVAQVAPAAAAVPQQAPTLTQAPVPSANALDGKALVAGRCSLCHGLSKVQRKHTAADWQYIVADMIDKGTPLNGDEEAAVLSYLTTNYGR